MQVIRKILKKAAAYAVGGTGMLAVMVAGGDSNLPLGRHLLTVAGAMAVAALCFALIRFTPLRDAFKHK